MKVILPFLIVVIISLSGCEKDITLNLQGTPPVLVISGFVTNKPIEKLMPQYQTGYIVKLSKTIDYYSADSTIPAVSGAVVVISDNATPSNIDTLTETPPKSGIYIGKPGSVGKSGLTYSLYVLSQGQVYTAQDRLDSIPKIDTALATVNTGRRGGYHLTYYTRNYPGDHYYLFKFYRNDTLLNNPNSIFVDNASGVIIDPSIPELQQQAPYIYQLHDSTMLELFSISQTVFNYYSALDAQINTDGGFFSSIPANVPGNLSGGAVGIFQASMYWTNKTVIK